MPVSFIPNKFAYRLAKPSSSKARESVISIAKANTSFSPFPKSVTRGKRETDFACWIIIQLKEVISGKEIPEAFPTANSWATEKGIIICP